MVKFEISKFSISKNTLFWVFLTFIALYVAISLIVSGVLAGHIPFNHILYVVNIIVVVALLGKIQSPFVSELNCDVKRIHWQTLAMLLVIIVLLALLLVNVHGELGGAQNRFGID